MERRFTRRLSSGHKALSGSGCRQRIQEGAEKEGKGKRKGEGEGSHDDGDLTTMTRKAETLSAADVDDE